MEAAPFTSPSSPFKTPSISSSSSSFISLSRFFSRNRSTSKFKSLGNLSVRASNDDSVTLLDYGAGNVRSVRNAIRRLGFQIKDVQTPKDILNARRLIFPGVGAFAPAMDVLNNTGMGEALCTYIQNDRPFLGICLGLQLLFESSDENGPVGGLGLIPGVVGRFDSSNGFRVPHIGWNALQITKDSEILDEIGNRHVYFVHSYRAMPSNENKEWISSTCNYGDEFIASVRRGNVHATLPLDLDAFCPDDLESLAYVVDNHVNVNKTSYLTLSDIISNECHRCGSFNIEEVFASKVIFDRVEDKASSGSMNAEDQSERVFLLHCVLNKETPRKAPEEFHHKEANDIASLQVIACLDVRTNDEGDLVVTKGDQYNVREHAEKNEVRNLGKPVELAGQYYKDGADEISFLNITGFRDFPLGDLPMLQVLRCASENVFVPLTVGGGIRDFTDSNGRYYSSMEVASEYFRSGADKISIGSDAVHFAEEYLKTKVKTGKSSIEQISRVYGNQAVVVSIDPRRVYLNDPSDVEFECVRLTNPGMENVLVINGGREGRPIGAYELAKAVEELGAGEILLNCIDCDGQGKGFDIDLVKMISDAVSIPVIASSGAGAAEHFSDVFSKTNASAALAAGIFHRKETFWLAGAHSVCKRALVEGRHRSQDLIQFRVLYYHAPIKSALR
ncbi:unnamed protein product [Dovyalis caffra]|uniref:Glutamine amidotransferase domain-containing protein n=1 Tax=Dovyalis caffra TaxID=77055 RepID=A0AAV1RA92_9ROSI|nr:unnamed protein product [Dovyalis caffra]